MGLKNWEEWDVVAEQGRHKQMHGDFARGQRALPERKKEIVIFHGTFARGMRAFPDPRA